MSRQSAFVSGPAQSCCTSMNFRVQQFLYDTYRAVVRLGNSQSKRTVSCSAVVQANGAMEIERVYCLKDNYCWIVHDPVTNTTGVVDPSEPEPVTAALEERGWRLQYILNTHHHWDHTGGNMALKKKFNCTIVGPKADAERIPGIDVQVGDGDVWKFGRLDWHVFDTPGHTRGHITYWVPDSKALFPGDTLFALGCGRLFEGTPEQMWASLSKLVELPRDTQVFCAHEYTQSNARFAVTVDPGNAKLQERKRAIDEMRAKGEPTVPSLLGDELDTNPFLRTGDPAIRRQAGASDATPDWQVFAHVRKAKDNF